ncbi:MAG TPA: sulfite exporter TauE/SafE family protein [Acidocella sp.]|nr:sulfite exporter TauE/SafE family protein [Acidocella sp.]
MVVWLGAFFGGIISGASGFGFALIAASFWLHRLTPVEATALITGCSILVNAGLMWPLRTAIEPRRLAPFAFGGLLGVPIGVWVLSILNVSDFRLILGTLMTLFGLYVLFVRRLPVFAHVPLAVDVVVGAAGGMLSGLGGFAGVLPMIWTQLRGWPRDIARGVYQPFVLVVQIFTLTLIVVSQVDKTALTLIIISIPPLTAGSWIGWQLYSRMNHEMFRKLVAAGVMVSGLTLIF